MVPKDLQAMVWAHFRRTGGAAGRSTRMNDDEYLEAAEAAVEAVAVKEKL